MNMLSIIVILAALTLVFGLSHLFTRFICKKINRRIPRALQTIATVVIAVLLLSGITITYLSIYYHADDTALAVFDSDSPTVTKIDGGWFFDGEGEDTALVFYPGAKVEAQAYAPLMQKLAQNGVDCFLMEMPMRIAFLDPNAADKVIGSYHYDTWLMCGHSMGGVAATIYTSSHTDQVDGLILLASYPTEQIDDKVDVLSIYGSEDKVLDHTAYEKAKAYLPDDMTEVVIEGGNHAYFGNYGEQSGDGEAKISPEQQQTKTVYAILKLKK